MAALVPHDADPGLDGRDPAGPPPSVYLEDTDLQAAGPEVLGRLLGLERRPERLRRLLGVWQAKVRAAVGRGDLAAATAWVRVVAGHRAEGDVAAIRDEALAALAGAEFLEDLARAIVAGGEDGAATVLLGDLGGPAIGVFVDWMAVDDPPVPRRYIVGMMARAGRSDVKGLAARLGDERWFIVRNVAIALGRTGRSQAVEPLLAVRMHDDERVRVEVLRSVAKLMGDGAVRFLLESLGDPSRRVRSAGLSLLKASPSPDVVPGLAGLVESGSLDTETAIAAVTLIAGRRDPRVAEVLHGLAQRRLATGSRRAARDAARRLLERRAS